MGFFCPSFLGICGKRVKRKVKKIIKIFCIKRMVGMGTDSRGGVGV
jgi:hypothetical protein